MPYPWLLMVIVDGQQDGVHPAAGAEDKQLRAGCRSASRRLLRHGDVDAERRPDNEAAAGRQGVPVVLPVREDSSGGSYGTATEGCVCVLRFPVGFPCETPAGGFVGPRGLRRIGFLCGRALVARPVLGKRP